MRTTRRSRALVLAVLALVGAVSASCSDDDSSGADADSPGSVTTLSLATVDPRGRPASDDVEEFAAQVEALSDGAIVVEIIWDAAEGAPRAYETVATKVVDGTFDFGLVPAAAWDGLGVTSLRALQAPFLVTSDALVEEIVTGDLAAELLGGLGDAGVVGLGLLPETLRHPVGFAAPMVAPADFAGARVRVPVASSASYDLLGALGAEPVDLRGDALDAAVASGSLAGAESAFAQRASLPTLGTFTGNLTFFPKVNVLVGGADAMAGLDDDQREILEQAADATLAYVLETNPTDGAAAEEYCAAGGRVVLAADADVVAVKEATSAVSAALGEDDLTRSLIERIQSLEADVVVPDGAAAAACEPSADGQTAANPNDPYCAVERAIDERFGAAFSKLGPEATPADEAAAAEAGAKDVLEAGLLDDAEQAAPDAIRDDVAQLVAAVRSAAAGDPTAMLSSDVDAAGGRVDAYCGLEGT